ncbi:cytochrome P450 [Brasilonema sp. UFV-L1]|uniref:cytochrome P450 n=1 Tax=Brasilonema sp. UFV-L1 TaxID=2234130 RepID=UPI00145DE643|nr:cytochrome P450 [Brasilonema sp. UFV-L1]NMG09915.1 cytochrome P450 [Brasilonema sp. UFV-L1]
MIKQSISPVIRKAPPGPRGLPIVGNFPQIASNPLQFLTHATRQYGGVVHLGAMGLQQLYLVTDPESLKHMLLENTQNYTKGSNYQKDEAMTAIIGNGLVSSEGELWRRQRRMMQPALHRKQVANMTTVMTDITAQMLEEWRRMENAQPINMFKQMLLLTQKIILKLLLSLEPDSKESAELIRGWSTAFDFHCDRVWSVFKLPLSIPTPKNRKFLQAVRTVDGILQPIFQKRQQSNDDPNDILSMIMMARDESGKGMSDQQLRDEISALIGAGFETSGTSLAWTFYLLSQYPAVEEKLHSELATVLGGRTPTFEDLPNLKYTKMVVEEAMRIYPAVWINSRSTIGDDELGGYHIPGGSMIMLCSFVTHHLPEVWENPEDFVPERFAPERIFERQRHAYIPFGGGPRQCMGDVFALTEIQLVLAMIAQQYRLRPAPGYQLELEPKLVLQARGGLPMILEPRPSFVKHSRLEYPSKV